MEKLVYAGSIVAALILIAGSFWMPESASMWLASTSLVMNIARFIVVGLMVGLIFTDPPRRQEFRMLLGAVSVGFVAWSFWHLWNGSTMVIDSLLFLEAAVAFGLAALEGQPLVAPAKNKLATAGKLAGVYGSADSSMQGLALSQARVTNFAQQAFIATAIISGVLYKNIRPSRAVWHGG